MAENHSGGFGWGDEIDPTQERKERVLLPEGPARFVVTKIERKREEFGKFGPQNVAHVHMTVASESDETLEPVELEERLCLHIDMMWKITEFFTAIGQRKHGDKGKFVPDWAAAEKDGYGRCEITHRDYKNKKGEAKKANNIDKYLPRDEAGISL